MSTRRRLGEERLYYSPPAMRRMNQQQQLSSKTPSPSSSVSLPEKSKFVSDSVDKSNLDRFLEHTIPVVPAQHFPRTTMRSWRNRDGDFNPYFILSDLWEFYGEWSAYGAAVPLVLNESDAVVQYYVPYLSGIQLYIDPSRPLLERRRLGEESDTNSSRETSSDGDSDSGRNGGANITRGSWNHMNSRKPNQLGERSNPSLESSADGGNISNPPCLLIFEYFERELPFHRVPLADKMNILASGFPELKTLNSCNLSHLSWISVAWYPIYRIPVGPTLQNVDSCFLTFHYLAKPIRTSGVRDTDTKLSLPTFGLASYKFKLSDWCQNGTNGNQNVNSLLQSAENWLRLLQVNHHDYNFFTSHYLHQR